MPTAPLRLSEMLRPTGLLGPLLGGLLACGMAQAQLDHSFYGVADLSWGRFEPSGLYRQHRFNSNSLTASFIGATGSYGFENGVTAGVTLETFYRFQDLRTGRNDHDPLLSRNAFVSLTHRDWGQVRAGRLQTLLFNTTARFNALGNSVGCSPAVRHLFAAGAMTEAMDELLEILMRDKGWSDGLARKTYVAILELMSKPAPKAATPEAKKGAVEIAGKAVVVPGDPVIDSYRRKLSMALF